MTNSLLRLPTSRIIFIQIPVCSSSYRHRHTSLHLVEDIWIQITNQRWYQDALMFDFLTEFRTFHSQFFKSVFHYRHFHWVNFIQKLIWTALHSNGAVSWKIVFVPFQPENTFQHNEYKWKIFVIDYHIDHCVYAF